ncbi:WD repeat [Cryptosporidium sp. chipmunk genotype I]|uniref:WD repeat n=1 Tax=Cryptosporidium sp. chipmunk genotype I TaxID=1280935 RepID=UPI00351A376F|nr:WD repeat [Cryptosporidium sp. chipmunk genotype I]
MERSKVVNRFGITDVYHGLGIPISMVYSRNLLEGALLCVGDSEGHISLYSTEDKFTERIAEPGIVVKKDERIFSRKVHSGTVTDTRFQNVGIYSEKAERYIYSSSTDSFLVKFDLEHEKESCRLRAHKEWVKRFALSVEPSSLIATVGNDGSLRIYDDRSLHLKCSSLGQGNIGGNKVTSSKSMLGQILTKLSIQTTERNCDFNESYYESIEKVRLAPIFELNRIHENSGRKSIGREKMISDKSISVSGVTFLSESNYIATSGCTDGQVKVWDIRKASSGSTERACVFKFSPQKCEDTQRGITWMDADELYNKLALQTRRGIIYIYSVSGILSCSKDLSAVVIDSNKVFHEKENIELLDASQRPTISSDGEWLITASNSGSKFYLFNISMNSESLIPYYSYESQEESSIPIFQCFAWERGKFNMDGAQHFPLKDWNVNFREARCVGREYRLNFSVGTKLKKLSFYNNKEFQSDNRNSVMPNFSGVSARGDANNSRTTVGKSEESGLKSRWVSGETLSYSNSFDGDMDVANQLSLSSSLSVPFPKPSRASKANDLDLTLKSIEERNEKANEESQELKTMQGERKTGFLTIGGIGFSEKDSQALSDNGAFGRPTLTPDSVEKTPFRKSIPFMGSSQDSVGYPAPQRGQSNYMTQSQESLLTPVSPQKDTVDSKGTLEMERESGNVSSNHSYDFNSRRIIHIPLSQTNEEVIASPGIDRTEFFEVDCTIYSESVPRATVSTPGSLDRDLKTVLQDDKCEEGNKGFKQRRLDSWVRVRKSTEGGSTANCSTAELSPVS